MANVIPQGELKFYSGIHTGRPMLFSSAANRDSYFSSHQSMSVGGNNYTVIKKQANKVRVTLNSTNPGQFNYLSFRNPNFEDLTYYCRILDYYWINQECCEYTFAIDIWLTYCFDVTYNSCFIERESLSEVEYNAASQYQTLFDVRKMRTDEPLAVGEELQIDVNSGITLALGDSYSGAKGKFVNVVFISGLLFGENDDPIDGETYNKYQWYKGFCRNVAGSPQSGDPTYSNTPGMGAWHSSDENQNSFMLNSSISGYFDGNTLVNALKLPCDVLIIENNACVQELLDQLTLWNALSSITALYTMPLTMVCACFRDNHSLGTLLQVVPRMPLNDPNVSPKLATFPYTYIKVTAPDGNQKEFHFEWFNSMKSASGTADFYLTGALNGLPKVSLTPVSYKKVIQNKEDYTESMCYQGFPQIPYCTDSFLAYLASASTDLMRSNTAVNRFGMAQQAYALEQAEHEYDRRTTTGLLGTLLQTDPTTYSGALAGADIMLNTKKSVEYAKIQQAFAEEFLKGDKDLLRDSFNLSFNSTSENNTVVENLNGTRPSFVVADYHKTSDGGYEIFDAFNPCDFIVEVMALRTDVMYAYSAFFKEFGYALNTVALPIVANYVSGDSSIIHWDDNKTYIKTRDMHVTAALRPVQEFIEAMFNGGTQFIRGESL